MHPTRTNVAESALLPRDSIPATVISFLRIAGLPCAFLAAVVIGTLVGTADIPPGETLRILVYKLGLYHTHALPLGDQAIIWDVRLPRVLGAALVGAGLGVAGTLFQAVLRNPLADPYVIGTAAGAQVGVAIGFLLPYEVAVMGFGTMQLLAFAGAVGTVLFVYSLARTAGRTPIVTLLLAGFVTSSFLISGTSFLLLASNHMDEVIRWTMGSMNVSDLGQLTVTGPLIAMGVCTAYLLAPRLDLMLLGEDQAAHLGVRVERLKLGVIVLAALLTALAVTLAGVVAFVGLVVPHTARLIYGPGHRVLVPASALGGGIFLILSDLIARVAMSPAEIPLGAVTAVVGAPFFLHLLRRSRREYAV